MTGRQVLTRGERTRQSILDAAERLFLANGYHGTSMRQIAHAAGVALGGIYNHFSSKEEIFRALLAARLTHSPVPGILDSIEADSGPEMLRNAFARLMGVARENVDLFSLVITDVREFEGSTIRVLISSAVPELVRFMTRAQAAGGLRDDLDPRVLMRLFISVLIGYLVTDLIGYADGLPLMPGLPDAREARAGVLDILLNGVAAQKPEA